MNIYIGNLPTSSTEEELKKNFQEYGEVKSVKIIVDHETTRSRGFGFVEMQNQEEAEKAIAGLNKTDLQGRALIVAPAHRKE